MTLQTKAFESATAHSEIGASSYYRWSVCAPSVKLSRGIKAQSSKYAEEGTLAHSYAAYYLEHGEFPKGVNIPLDMMEAIMVYVNAIYADERAAYGQSSVERYVEVGFDLSSIYPGAWGTADCVVYYRSLKLLRVYDYKHGAGIPVEVKDNGQLKYYGLGAMLHLKNLEVDRVELVVVQPRCFHNDGAVRRFEIAPLDLLDFAGDIVNSATRCYSDNAEFVEGSHCHFCPAAAICPQLAKKALVAAQTEFKPTLSYSPEVLSKALEMVPILKAWTSSVEEFAFNEAMNGKPVPGYKIVSGRGSRKWAVGTTAEGLELELNVPSQDLMTTPELKSVAQVEKLLNKDQKKFLGGVIVSMPGAPTLAPNSDRREAITSGSEFSKIEHNVQN